MDGGDAGVVQVEDADALATSDRGPVGECQRAPAPADLQAEGRPDPGRWSVEAVHQTLAYYDLQAFAPRVTATTLLMAGAPGALLGAQTLQPLVTALRGQVTVHDSEQSSYKDGLYTERWMATQCGITDIQSILPERWR